MLRLVCFVLVFSGACIMFASIAIYRKTIKAYSSYLPAKKGISLNLYASIMVLMIFFLLGYLATLFFIINAETPDMSMFLVSVIFFFGAIFCFSVVYVQSELLNRLERNAGELRLALDESEKANLALEDMNTELTTTMEELRNTQKQLIFSEKMSTLGKLMAGISHEINTPLGIIRASAQSMEGSFSERLYPLFEEIRQLSESEYKDFITYIKIALANAKQNYSLSEIRALKREVRKTLADAEGFDENILDLLTRASMLDSDTITALRPRLAFKSLSRILELVNRIVHITTSVGNISQSSDRIMTIISSMKSFSHLNAHNEKLEFSVISGIKMVLAIFTNQLKYNVEVVTDYENVPNIVGYEDELNQVWSNLIQNAIYAMSEENSAGEMSAKEGSKLNISVKSDDKNVVVVIRDNGTGIDSSVIADIFEPFYTTKPTGIGSGLGLSISKQIVDLHRGTIEAESEKGQGSTFTVTLPL